MGCWNETDAVTQLPILHGQPVRYLILTSQDSELLSEEFKPSGYCGQYDLVVPRAVPIRGKYNDYGGVEEVEEGLNTEIIVESYQKDLDFITKRGELLHVSKENCKDLENLLHGISGDEVNVRGRNGKPFKTGGIFILEEVYQFLVDTPIPSDYGEHTLSKQKFLDSGMDFIEEAVDRIESDKDLAKLLEGTGKMSPESIREVFQMTLGANNIFALSMKGMRHHYSFSVSNYAEVIAELVQSKKVKLGDKKLTRLIEDMAEFFMASMTMSRLRKSWMPQIGKGSQDSTYDLHIGLSKVITKVAENQEKLFEES